MSEKFSSGTNKPEITKKNLKSIRWLFLVLKIGKLLIFSIALITDHDMNNKLMTADVIFYFKKLYAVKWLKYWRKTRSNPSINLNIICVHPRN